MFRTELSVPPSQVRISLSDRILTVGSCFSDTIGNQFLANKLQASANPFGIIYNPVSIHKVIQYAIGDQPIPENSFLTRQDIHLNYDFHSDRSSMDLDALKKQLKELVSTTHTFLKETKWLILTYGTAWVYTHLGSGQVVANCHKMPRSTFTRTLLTQQNILESFDDLYRNIKAFNPGINVLLTVSPVRHLKETMELNCVSKSLLRVASQTITEEYADVHYFPAYEIMIDDLRDYRFYKSDMIHPSAVAEAYIWEKFCAQFCDDELNAFLIRWKEIQSALAHKPFHPASSAHQQFLRSTLKKLEELKQVVNVEQEIAAVRTQLFGNWIT